VGETPGRCPAPRDSLSARPGRGAGTGRGRPQGGLPAGTGPSSPSRGGQRGAVSAERDPSAEEPTSGNSRFPDPFAPSPGDQDLPWKATAERRDLWGPVQEPLEGTVRSPASRAVGRPRRPPFVRFGAPAVLGGLAALAAATVVLGTGLGGPLLALAAAAGLGVVTLGGVGIAVNAPRRGPRGRPALDAPAPDGTRAVLERILEADATTRERVARLRPGARSTPSAALVLDDIESLLTRIDALVAAEQVQTLRPSAPEVTMLEGIAARYVPELVDAASDTIGFLQTFAGTARQEALTNLESVHRQLGVLGEGVEQIESDVVGGVSRSLEVHSEFLRTRFADQHV